jgi:hypothetical protein
LRALVRPMRPPSGLIPKVPVASQSVRIKAVRQESKCILAVACCLTLGCPGDPVRTTRQTFRLRLSDAASGAPVAGMSVQFKDDFDQNDAMGKIKWVDEQHRRDTRDWWEKRPWFTCLTDVDGRAEGAIVTTTIDRNRGNKPLANRDETGNPFLFKIVPAQGPAETVSVWLRVGESKAGTRFRITIIEIDKPGYVNK